jgi:serine/threonine-protein kinase
MMQVRDEPPPLPATIPVGTREIIEAVLVKDPTQRYSTGGEFAEAVAAVRRGEPMPVPRSISGAIPVATPRPTPSRGRAPTPKPSPKPAPTPTPTPSPVPKPSPRRAADPVRPRSRSTTSRTTSDRSAGQARRPARHHAPPPAPPTEPLRLQPRSGRSRTVLLVLFVLLTLAAVVVGFYVLRTFVLAGPDAPGPAVPGTAAGTVDVRGPGGPSASGPVGAVAVNGSAVVGHPAASVGWVR